MFTGEKAIRGVARRSSRGFLPRGWAVETPETAVARTTKAVMRPRVSRMLTSEIRPGQNARPAPRESVPRRRVRALLLRATAITLVEQLARGAELAAVRFLHAERAAEIVHAVLVGCGRAATRRLVADARGVHRARLDVARRQAAVAAMRGVGAAGRGGDERHHARAHRLGGDGRAGRGRRRLGVLRRDLLGGLRTLAAGAL